MAVGESDTIRFGTAPGADDGADDDGADDDGADEAGDDALAEPGTEEDAALLEGADDTAAGMDAAGDGVVATDEVVVPAEDVATPRSVPQPASSAQQVRVAARADRRRMEFLTVVEARATLDGKQAAVNRRPFLGAG